ncbi:beta-ketoacyl synthase N-terminal-like domain-containing protein [Paraflavisolibacter sp. H34]|uniref:type I polyketide synthase n=1 Tax=Huijunlia imazamoxiresistens TaxID=3127457 RepID=UPI003017C5EA
MNYPVSITDIAVIGIALRFPGAKNPEEFFQNIKEGKSCIEFFPEESYDRLGVYEKGPKAQYVPASGVIRDVDRFDAEFFNVPATEASLMDPQHRVLLECAWEALEGSGYAAQRDALSIGVYASCSRNTYLLSNILQNEKVVAATGMYPLMIGNQGDFISTRISYKLGLTGPSVNLQTACSSSLVAVHYACQDLIMRNCDLSLVGGSTIHTPQEAGYNFEESGILSPTGQCHPFDQNSSGTVPGNGACVLILKRLQNAIDDKDRIYAVIKGTRINNDGNQKVGFTAPSISGQEKVIRDCLKFARVKPEQIGLVEAHGTGTRVGDPIEIASLKKAFNTRKEGYCAVSSVKSQIGHLDATAGLAGLVKAILCLEGKLIPPAPYLTALNPNIDNAQSPFYFPQQPREWTVEPGNWRYAGVSSFGVGGTNAHAVLMEAPVAAPGAQKEGPVLLPFSAKNPQALHDLLLSFAAWFQQAPEADLQKVSYTLWKGRTHFRECRTFVIASDSAEAQEQLLLQAKGAPITSLSPEKLRALGSDWVAGADVQASLLFDEADKSFIPLPTYAFQRKRYWIEPLAPLVPVASETLPAPVSSQSSLEVILELWKELIGLDMVRPEDDFFELGGDSLMAIQFASRLKERFKVVLSLDELLETGSAAEVDELLRGKLAAAEGKTSFQLFSGQPFQQLRRGDKSLPPLVLFHPAGGTVYCYHELLRQAALPCEVYAVQFPLEMLQQDVRLVPGLAKEYLRLVREHLPADAYYLGGYSLGGNIAFEIATLLQQEDPDQVKGLWLIDSHAPGAYKGEISGGQDLVASFPYVLGSFLNLPLEAGEQATNLQSLYNRLQEAGILTGPIDYKEFELLFRVWRYNHLSLRNYDHERRYTGDVVVFRAREDESEAFLQKLNITRVEKTDWQQYIEGSLEIIDVPGNHMSMLAQPHVQELAAAFHRSFHYLQQPAGTFSHP